MEALSIWNHKQICSETRSKIAAYYSDTHTPKNTPKFTSHDNDVSSVAFNNFQEY